MKRALITGITGQDGCYLSELLLAEGYEVHGIIRRASSFNTDRIDHIYEDPHESGRHLFLHYGDLTDATVLLRVIEKAEPHEVYNLGAQSHAKVSFEEPEHTADVAAMGTLRLLDCVRTTRRGWGSGSGSNRRGRRTRAWGAPDRLSAHDAMSVGAWLTLAVVAGVINVLATDRFAPSLTLFTAVVVLMVTGVITPAEAFSGFSIPAPITGAALFVLAGAVERTGGLQPIVHAVL